MGIPAGGRDWKCIGTLVVDGAHNAQTHFNAYVYPLCHAFPHTYMHTHTGLTAWRSGSGNSAALQRSLSALINDTSRSLQQPPSPNSPAPQAIQGCSHTSEACSQSCATDSNNTQPIGCSSSLANTLHSSSPCTLSLDHITELSWGLRAYSSQCLRPPSCHSHASTSMGESSRSMPASLYSTNSRQSSSNSFPLNSHPSTAFNPGGPVRQFHAWYYTSRNQVRDSCTELTWVLNHV
jgi:hypothetical protein